MKSTFETMTFFHRPVGLVELLILYDFQSNRPQVKSAPGQIGIKMKVILAQKNKNKKRINK